MNSFKSEGKIDKLNTSKQPIKNKSKRRKKII